MKKSDRRQVTPFQRMMAARIRVKVDQKRGVETPGWIVVLAEGGPSATLKDRSLKELQSPLPIWTS